MFTPRRDKRGEARKRWDFAAVDFLDTGKVFLSPPSIIRAPNGGNGKRNRCRGLRGLGRRPRGRISAVDCPATGIRQNSPGGLPVCPLGGALGDREGQQRGRLRQSSRARSGGSVSRRAPPP